MKKTFEGVNITRIILNTVIVASVVMALTSGFRFVG